MIHYLTPRHHWNYFLAIESDLKTLSRYVEFSQSNENTYSIELAHILLSASSEVDVVLKMICSMLEPGGKYESIGRYREVITAHIPDFSLETSNIPRFGMSNRPWENWMENKTPDWWLSYNKVKHERNNHYSKANLKNAICAVGGLLIAIVHYYKTAFERESGHKMHFAEVTRQLDNSDCFVKLQYDYYTQVLAI